MSRTNNCGFPHPLVHTSFTADEYSEGSLPFDATVGLILDYANIPDTLRTSFLFTNIVIISSSDDAKERSGVTLMRNLNEVGNLIKGINVTRS